MAMSESLRSELSSLVTANRVVLFMKGTRGAPQCGFSAQVVQILDELLPQYATVDVLRAPEMRDGIKEFSAWPTIPQLYIHGKFVGGCDIVRELNSSGELQQLLGLQPASVALPKIRVTEAAKQAFAAALMDAEGESLRLAIDARFQCELFFGPASAGDLAVDTNGPTLTLDPASARRAEGLCIDFVEGSNGGFKIDNPNAPASVQQVSAAELKALLDRGEILLFDVRPEPERALASIGAARPLDAEGQRHLAGLDRSTPVALHCHHGVRSQQAAQQLVQEGFKKVYNLKGGIEEWSQAVDPSVPRY